MNKIIQTVGQTTYERVCKRTARKYYNNGVDILACPVLVNIASYWGNYSIINNYRSDADFDHDSYMVEYYNCNSELGNYLAYYVDIKDIKDIKE